MNVTLDHPDLDGHDQLAALMAAGRQPPIARGWSSPWWSWSVAGYRIAFSEACLVDAQGRLCSSTASTLPVFSDRITIRSTSDRPFSPFRDINRKKARISDAWSSTTSG